MRNLMSERACVYALALAILSILSANIGESHAATQDGPEEVDRSFLETVDGVSFDMVYVEGGSFMMGGGTEEPVHEVVLSPYFMMSMEVTQELWNAVMPDVDIYALRDREVDISKAHGEPDDYALPVHKVGPDYPVYYVCYAHALEFCKRLSRITGRRYSLPTEAQWEYAARGRTGVTEFSGSQISEEVAWSAGNSGGHVHKVGTLKPNSLGIYDMSGNVLEWCQDRYLPYEEGRQADPLAASSVPGSDIVCRGGGWKSRPSECAVHCRYEGHINFGDDAMGFRVVCAAE